MSTLEDFFVPPELARRNLRWLPVGGALRANGELAPYFAQMGFRRVEGYPIQGGLVLVELLKKE